jgi:hypothetical protein
MFLGGIIMILEMNPITYNDLFQEVGSRLLKTMSNKEVFTCDLAKLVRDEFPFPVRSNANATWDGKKSHWEIPDGIIKVIKE